MVISFEEKDRTEIEAKGITIIEFKRFLYKGLKPAVKALCSLAEYILEYTQLILRAWNVFRKWFIEAVDGVKLTIEQISDYTCRPTSFRYKTVKFLSKCTGIEVHRLWKMTRRTWLARSCG